MSVVAKSYRRSTGGCSIFPVQGKQGYTFTEVLVGVCLLILMASGVFAGFSFGFTIIKVSQEDTRASQILLQKLETLRVYNWSQITNGYFPTNFPASFSTNGGVTYQGTIEIAAAPMTESYSNSVRQVTASLSWISTGVPRRRTVTTLVSENGIQTYKP